MISILSIATWVGLFVAYFFYEYVGTKNIIATNKLRATVASNTGALMYLIGILGTYLCVTEGLINIIPIIIGSWLGTYYSVKAEIKIKKKKSWVKK